MDCVRLSLPAYRVFSCLPGRWRHNINYLTAEAQESIGIERGWRTRVFQDEVKARRFCQAAGGTIHYLFRHRWRRLLATAGGHIQRDQ